MENVGIIGCGTMGHSVALNMAWQGLQIRIHAVDQAEKDRAVAGISAKLKVLKDNELIKEKDVDIIFRRILFSESISEVVEGRTFILEAISEDKNLKEELFIQLGKMCGRDVILASTTSGLKISEFAARTDYPERTIVTHFWNPAHLVPLVEIVKWNGTNEECVQRSVDFLTSIQKKPILLRKEIAGFIGNRLQFALFREAQYLLEEGVAGKEEIDAAVTYGIGRRLSVTGPLLTADMGGLDVFSTISNNLFPELSNANASFPVLRSLVEQNKYGFKSGEGYYTWDKSFSEKMQRERENELIRWLKNDRL